MDFKLSSPGLTRESRTHYDELLQKMVKASLSITVSLKKAMKLSGGKFGRQPGVVCREMSQNPPLSPFPTNIFTILEPQDQEISEFYVVQECSVTDFEASKL